MTVGTTILADYFKPPDSELFLKRSNRICEIRDLRDTCAATVPMMPKLKRALVGFDRTTKQFGIYVLLALAALATKS